ncbi:Glu/Leu/Phe/Val dehydrogenase dimerization domain-containing protein [Paraglaciecola arctica]|uniref:Glu/Leu/Phe/Val dehydrogenase dimerization domain-containing protein n=1 Tax=Paraglaciecola arctica TaxID=1128911 RepID=UPI001C077D76|nr:Glu/Leu/Phe/Val dehydrogenase dimerization domain-containing protein [Paraglaciecola arctica]MBU3003301.1 amino acid dehydrogenase [Paraglaciecola arctica]
MSVFEHSEFDEHEHVAFHQDKVSGLKAIIAVHNSNLGNALGGCRMWPYMSDEEAVRDVLRLSKGMTYKAAMAGLKQGGGKAVIFGNPRTEKTPEKMLAMGKFIDSLSGQYISAEDSGLTVDDLKLMGQQTDFVSGIQAKYHINSEPADGNPAPSTAYGVYVGLKATVKYSMNSDLKDVKVAIQGLGHVGIRLAKHLHNQGAKLYVTDIHPENIEKAVNEFSAVAVAPNDIYDLDVDVFAPCAMGAVLNEENIDKLNVKVIAGAANNQLAKESLGQLLTDKGIVYAPDYVINAGGIIDIYHQSIASSDRELREHIEKISNTLLEIYHRAQSQGIATNIVANEIAEERFGK